MPPDPPRPAAAPGSPPGSRPRPWIAVILALAAALAACGSSPEATTPAATPEPPGEVNVSQDEAALVVMGELVRVYGTDADPFAREATFNLDSFDGAPAWRAEVIADIQLDGRRAQRAWTMWIGVQDGSPAVLHAQERSEQD